MALANEFRFAMRMLAKNKGWTAVAALAMALGLGANVAIFSVVGLMLWPPLPYPHPEQLVYLPQTNAEKGFNEAAVSLPDARDWASGTTLAMVAAYRQRPMAISGTGEPQHIPAMQVTPEFFPALGVAPVLGRVFSSSETPETESRTAIISHALWQGTYGGEVSVLGREIRLDGRNYTITGVMPETFHFLYRPAEVWVPLSLEQKERVRSWRGLNTMARLKPGVTVHQAAAEVGSISARIEKEDPQSGLGWRGTVRHLNDRMIGSAGRAAATTMFGAVGFVLLIACANVASLLLARGTQRRRELALRASLGATRSSLVRLQLIESVLLSAIGGAAGVLSAIWTIPMLKRVAPAEMLVFQTARLDWAALAFGVVLALGTGLLFGAIPAWLLTRGDLAPGLQESGRGSTGGRHLTLKALVVTEMALALVLVAATTLMIRSLIRQSTANVGFDKDGLTIAWIMLPATRYSEPPRIADFFTRVTGNLRNDARIESAALVQTIPLGGDNSYSGVHVEGESDPNRDKITGDMVVGPGYFHTMRIPLLAGRDFTEGDNSAAARVAIVNETFVKRYWPKVSHPIGMRIRIGNAQAPWISVIGTVRDVRHTNITDSPRPEVYRPHAQVPRPIMMLVTRSRGSLQGSADAIRSAVRQVDTEQPVFRLQSMEAHLFNRGAGERATTQVLGGLAIVALILAAVGTYGVMAYTAATRMREIGIRLAIGATQKDVFGMVLRSGVGLALLGLLIGLPAAWAVTPVLRALSAGMDAQDTAAYSAVALLLFVVALGACAVPAWRAMRVDPARVLRDE
jgi:putative ABC transport system permease protein